MSIKLKKNVTLEIIKLVDKEYHESVLTTFLNSEFGFLNVFLIIVMVILELYFLFYFRSETAQTIMTEIPAIFTLLISFLALMVSLRAFVGKSEKKLQVERNYYLISRNYAQKTRLEKLRIWKNLLYGVEIPKAEENSLLKAIIKIKAKNPQLTLEKLYDTNKSLFSEKKLIESLLYD
jgi:carbon starvation protein CstA